MRIIKHTQRVKGRKSWKAKAINYTLLSNMSVSSCRKGIKTAHLHRLISRIAWNKICIWSMKQLPLMLQKIIGKAMKVDTAKSMCWLQVNFAHHQEEKLITKLVHWNISKLYITSLLYTYTYFWWHTYVLLTLYSSINNHCPPNASFDSLGLKMGRSISLLYSHAVSLWAHDNHSPIIPWTHYT